jgi:hypothetical protein
MSLPRDARVLAVQAQPIADDVFGHTSRPRVWALVDPDAPSVWRRFRLLVTGKQIEDGEMAGLDYVGTFQLGNGAFVGHLFERRD